jgi:glycosyltransferase involved in cell wall biosynthesis
MTHVRASVVLLTYNQEAFVKEALQSLLDQDYDDLEIVVSDDASKDKTWDVVLEVCRNYVGPKQVVLNRNTSNLGVVGNYFRAFNLSCGEVVFTAAGDDVSLPQRVSTCVNLWLKNQRKPDLIAADAYDMCLSGEILGTKVSDHLNDWNLTKWTEQRPYMFGASHMMTRRLLALRGLSPELSVEDQCLVIRALMMGGAIHCPLALVQHRRGGISQTKRVWTYALKLEQLRKSSQQALIEIENILQDAGILGVDIKDNLMSEKRLNEFALAILRDVGWGERFRLLYLYSDVSWRKRWKFLSFSAFKMVHEVAFFLKSKR